MYNLCCLCCLDFTDLTYFWAFQTNIWSKYTQHKSRTLISSDFSVSTDITTSYYSSIARATNNSKNQALRLMQQSFWPILCANKKPCHKDYWEAVKVGLFSSFQHKPFLTEKTASLASKEPYTVHTFVVLSNFISTSLKRYAVSTITPSPFLIVQKQIAGQIKAEDRRVDCSLQRPKLEVR